MNKKRKILTLVTLLVFGAIIALHYITPNIFEYFRFRGGAWLDPHAAPYVRDIRMPLFVLAVFYAGLFAILGDNKRKEQ
jgi:hypothetical protein